MRRFAVMAIVVMLLIVSGCAGTSGDRASSTPVALASAATAVRPTAHAATPHPAPTATPRPTPPATLDPTAKPTPRLSPPVDPTTGLRIAAPYELQRLDPVTNAAYEAAMGKALGSLSSSPRVGIRQATNSGSPSGFVMVLEFNDPNVAHMTGFLDAVAGGSAASLGAKLGKKTILGTAVRYASSAQGAFAAYLHGEAVVYVITATSNAALDVITAVIKANG